ncbi:MAG TPA: group I intron-associated PD-(D/E)XK endonuclease [Trebonia sp.]
MNRRVKKDVIRLGLDVSHFKGTRTWDDAQLVRAVADAKSWDEVYTALGLHTLKKETRVRVMGNALRLGLDLEHLDARSPRASAQTEWQVDPMRLRDCATPLAAAWFMMRGCVVSLPAEQAIYDLVVDPPSGAIMRVQVKSTIRTPDEAGAVAVCRRPYAVKNLAPRLPYDPKVIDYFFIVDGDYNIYLIPSRVIAGRLALTLRAYKQYVVGNVRRLLADDRPTVGEVALGGALMVAGRGRAVRSSRSLIPSTKEVAVMADVEEWLARAGEALGVPVEDVLPKDLRREMLDLTGDIAHNVVRVAVPWTSYLMGVAVGRGASPAEAMRIVRELLPPAPTDEQQ